MRKNSPLFLDIGHDLFIMLGLPKIPTWGISDRPKKAKRGTLGFNTKTNSLEYYDGAFWFAAIMRKG